MAGGKLILASRAGGKPNTRIRVRNSKARTTVSKVNRLSKLVHSIMPERKHAGVNLFGSTVSSTASITPVFNFIGQGTDETDRTGNEISVNSVSIPMQISANAVLPALSTETVRVLLILDKQNNGTNPAIADILDIANASYPFMALQNLYNTKRFKWLYDRKFTLSLQNYPVFNKTIHKSFKFLKVEYDKNDIPTKNQLYFVLLSDQAVTMPSLVADLRVNFIDN